VSDTFDGRFDSEGEPFHERDRQAGIRDGNGLPEIPAVPQAIVDAVNQNRLAIFLFNHPAQYRQTIQNKFQIK
jgi:hypothetical protein